MTVLPVAAQAGTRAGDNSATYAVSAPGKGRDAKGESLFGLGFLASFFVVGIGVVATVVTVVVTTNNGRTPGAR